MKRRGVVFNEKDPHQKKLLDHADNYTNFSAYVKSLIQKDMDGVWSHPVSPVHEDQLEVTRDIAEGFL